MNENNILAQNLSCHIPFFFGWRCVLPGCLRYLVCKQKLCLRVELGMNCGYVDLPGANDIS